MKNDIDSILESMFRGVEGSSLKATGQPAESRRSLKALLPSPRLPLSGRGRMPRKPSSALDAVDRCRRRAVPVPAAEHWSG